MKNYLLVLLAVCGIGIFANTQLPETPEVKTDIHAEVTSDEPHTIDAMLLSEFNLISKASLESVNETAEITPVYAATPVISYAQTYSNPAPVAPVNYAVNYRFYSRSEYAANAENLQDGVIYRYYNMIFGHERSTALGTLKYRQIGEIISITDETGATQNYQITDRADYTYQELSTIKGLMSGIESASGHGLTLFTCSSYGRLVLYLDAV